MEEIPNNHLGYMKHGKQWDKLHLQDFFHQRYVIIDANTPNQPYIFSNKTVWKKHNKHYLSRHFFNPLSTDKPKSLHLEMTFNYNFFPKKWASWKLTYPFSTFEDCFPFCKVGYLSSPEGMNYQPSNGWCTRLVVGQMILVKGPCSTVRPVVLW